MTCTWTRQREHPSQVERARLFLVRQWQSMRIGSLFSGYGGLDLAVESGLRALGQRGRVVWQAEKDPYCRAVLRKHWPRVRCYEDVHDIDDHAPPCDLLGGGFPCQDISIAGGRVGLAGARSGLWFEFVRVVRILRPAVVFVENVPELSAHLGRVLGPLAELGFDAEWDLFDAAAVGAPHRRERLFILAYAPYLRREVGLRGGAWEEHAAAPRPCRARPLADADGGRQLQPAVPEQAVGPRPRDRGAAVADGSQDGAHERRERPPISGTHVGDAEGQRRNAARGDAGEERRPPTPDDAGRWWSAEPDVGRVVDGPASRLDRRRRRARIRCLGNGVVPQQGALAFVKLAQRADLDFTRLVAT